MPESEDDEPSPNGENKKAPLDIVCSYRELNEQTRELIEGTPYSELPDEVLLKPKVALIFPRIRDAVSADLTRRIENPKAAEVRRRLQAYLEKRADDPNAARHLRGLQSDQDLKPKEGSQKMYLVNGQVLQGALYIDADDHVPTIPRRDGIDDRSTIVKAHSHPSTAPFSRGDLGIMLKSDEYPADKCIYPLVAGDLDFLAIVSSDAPRLPVARLRTELRIGHGFKDMDAYFAELDELGKALPSTIPQGRPLQFATQLVDTLNFGNQFKVGIYARESQDKAGIFKRLSIPQVPIVTGRVQNF